MLPFSENNRMVIVDGQRIDTTVISPLAGAKAQVVLLHGAGESTKDRCLPLAQALGQLGWQSLSFSYPGHGASSGQLLGSTLAGRQKLTHQLMRQLNFDRPEMLIGVSMGCHTAISLLGNLVKQPDKLVLFAPAAYAQTAESVPFGPAFSGIIRTPYSYRTAKTWEILPTFTGKLVMFQAGLDTVIPTDIYELISRNATNVNRLDHVFISDSAHQISLWMSETTERVNDIARAINTFDFSGLSKYNQSGA